jgi:heme-degrading monooxygenase HmoA
MFIAMNRFRVKSERAAEFEQRWKERQSFLAGTPGFVRFALLRGDEPGDYVSHSMWESRAAFDAWAHSDAFRAAHANPMPRELFDGPSHLSLYESVVEA